MVSLLVARLFDLVVIGLLFLSAAFLQLGLLPREVLAYVWATVFFVALVVLAILALTLQREFFCHLARRGLDTRLLKRLPGQPRFLRVVDDVETSLGLVSAPKQYAKILGSSLAVWLSNFGMLHIVLMSLGTDNRPLSNLCRSHLCCPDQRVAHQLVRQFRHF